MTLQDLDYSQLYKSFLNLKRSVSSSCKVLVLAIEWKSSAGSFVLREPIHYEIREILAEIFEVEPERIKDNDHLVEKLGADSLMALELVTKLEERYDIKIESEDFPKMTTLDSTVELVKHLMKT